MLLQSQVTRGASGIYSVDSAPFVEPDWSYGEPFFEFFEFFEKIGWCCDDDRAAVQKSRCRCSSLMNKPEERVRRKGVATLFTMGWPGYTQWVCWRGSIGRGKTLSSACDMCFDHIALLQITWPSCLLFDTDFCPPGLFALWTLIKPCLYPALCINCGWLTVANNDLKKFTIKFVLLFGVREWFASVLASNTYLFPVIIIFTGVAMHHATPLSRRKNSPKNPSEEPDWK